ncbi:DUF2865 domain-containing protein [Labrys wisconsinensis]|uniref:DUF2865 domain-containing protein n=1 Tax=Labrys wisconsinensis TaxID=425677 RepID=A0ABU0JCP4_9HYPH|nr:DUF2865 domain-containing protein [Labrys wisconsinensis]MDQ0470912.1 hypothetical protein [Labrys wisconsinensis]
MQSSILRAAVFSAVMTISGAALAQDARCARLDAQLRAIEQESDADPARVERYRDAVERQAGELQRTQDYAASIGCDSALFEPPAQCRALDANIRRMDRNLGLLQRQLSRLSGDLGARREAERQRTLALLARLDCNGLPAHEDPDPDQLQASGTFEQLFGPDGAEPHAAPPDADRETALPDTTLPPFGPLPRGSNLRTICVRTCDGYFFPISFATSSASFAGDAETCRRQCPGATVELYAYDNGSQKVEDAVSTVSGGLLSAMPNAFKFRTKLDKSCTCHAQGEASIQSRAPAGDALKRLDEPASPGQGAAAPPAPVAAAPRKAAIDSLPTTEGREIEVTNPDGTKKRVRVIAPGLTPVQ